MPSDDLEDRVTALEQQVADLSRQVQHSAQDAAAARVLAGAADRDVSEIRDELRDFRNATTSSFNALRQDFVDLRTHVDQGFANLRAEMNDKFEHVDRGFIEMRGKLDAAAAGQQTIVDLLHRIIDD